MSKCANISAIMNTSMQKRNNSPVTHFLANVPMQRICTVYCLLGTAMEALSTMQSFLKSRPSSFSSLEQGIEWRYKLQFNLYSICDYDHSDDS